MTKIVDLTAERGRRDAPDPEFVRRDEFGRELCCFSLTYRVDNEEFGIDLWAYDFADAERRVRAIRSSLELAGQVFERHS